MAIESYKYKSQIATAAAFIAGLIVYIGQDNLKTVIPAEYANWIPIIVLVAGYILAQVTENKRVNIAEQIVREEYNDPTAEEDEEDIVVGDDVDDDGCWTNHRRHRPSFRLRRTVHRWWIMGVEYDCVHESLIQSHSTDIQSLKTRADYKDKRLDDLDAKIEKMSEKLDKMNENINQLILQSNESDKDIEIRVKAIETELKLQKETTKNRLTLVGIGLTVITIGINVLFNILK